MKNSIRFNSIQLLVAANIFLLALSNILVQYPFESFGLHTTWGAFTYPAIFILTDLTVRFKDSQQASNIVYMSMVPGLLISYVTASYLESTHLADFFTLHIIPLRIALACLIAYVIGQLADILVFSRFCNNANWWLAPTLSATAGNFMDTVLFFSIAFYHSSNPFMNAHWIEIASVDFCFKIAISILAFVPIYGAILNLLVKKGFAFHANKTKQFQ